MNKKFIVKESRKFNEIIASGKQFKNHFFVVFYKNNDQSYSRYGISVGKKVGKAVERNYLKRRVRAILREQQKCYDFSIDCIIIVRKSCLSSDYEIMKKNLLKLLTMIKEKKDEEKEKNKI